MDFVYNLNLFLADLPSLFYCSNLQHLFIKSTTLSSNTLNILQAISQSLPYSLQVISLRFDNTESSLVFNEDTRDFWQKLDTTLSGSIYFNIQYIQILWFISKSLSRSIDSMKISNAIFGNPKQVIRMDNITKNELNNLNNSDIFLNYLPYLYKNKLLLCGNSTSYLDVYPVYPSAIKSKIWKSKIQLNFYNIEV